MHCSDVASEFKARQAVCDNGDCEQLIGFIRDVLSSVSLHARVASQLLLLAYELLRRELEAIVADVLKTTLLGTGDRAGQGSIVIVEASAEYLFERLYGRYLQARLVEIGFAPARLRDSHLVIEAASAVLDREEALLHAIHRVVGKAWGKQCFAQLHEMLRSVRSSMELSVLFHCYQQQQADRALFLPTPLLSHAVQPMPDFGVLLVAERAWDRLWSCSVTLPKELEA
jgi:hypothetical protein